MKKRAVPTAGEKRAVPTAGENKSSANCRRDSKERYQGEQARIEQPTLEAKVVMDLVSR